MWATNSSIRDPDRDIPIDALCMGTLASLYIGLTLTDASFMHIFQNMDLCKLDSSVTICQNILDAGIIDLTNATIINQCGHSLDTTDANQIVADDDNEQLQQVRADEDTRIEMEERMRRRLTPSRTVSAREEEEGVGTPTVPQLVMLSGIGVLLTLIVVFVVMSLTRKRPPRFSNLEQLYR
jgi:hypothetical protein